MDKTSAKLTIFFEEPFWVGIFERLSDGEFSVCKITFGAEPKDGEVWNFLLKHYDELRFSPAIEITVKITANNPKRKKRNVRKQLQPLGVGTKSQQALQLQREKTKTERKQINKEQREAEKQRHFELRKQKRKAKRRGH